MLDAIDGSILNIDFSLISANGKAEELKELQADGAGGASWGSENGCASITTRIARQEGVARISGHHDYPAPVRLFVNMQAISDAASFRSLVGFIRFKDLTLSIQGDSRLGTTIDPQQRTVKLCSDPRGQKTVDWAIDLRSGSMDEIRDALQSVLAPLVDASGKVIGFSKK